MAKKWKHPAALRSALIDYVLAHSGSARGEADIRACMSDPGLLDNTIERARSRYTGGMLNRLNAAVDAVKQKHEPKET